MKTPIKYLHWQCLHEYNALLCTSFDESQNNVINPVCVCYFEDSATGSADERPTSTTAIPLKRRAGKTSFSVIIYFHFYSFLESFNRLITTALSCGHTTQSIDNL
jgi:hypothetical protein